VTLIPVVFNKRWSRHYIGKNKRTTISSEKRLCTMQENAQTQATIYSVPAYPLLATTTHSAMEKCMSPNIAYSAG